MEGRREEEFEHSDADENIIQPLKFLPKPEQKEILYKLRY